MGVNSMSIISSICADKAKEASKKAFKMIDKLIKDGQSKDLRVGAKILYKILREAGVFSE